MKTVLRSYTLFILLIGSMNLLGQQCQVNGLVQDEHGHALPGANIQVLDMQLAGTSNDMGKFKLQVSCDQKIKLKISYLGFTSLDTLISPDNQKVLRLQLQSDAEHLDELIIEAHQNSDHLSLSNDEVSASFLRENDQGTLIKTMEQIPGVQAINVGVGIAKPVLRGMSLNRVVVTGNGVRQEGQQWGADHGLEMDPFDAEHVEVIKGPATLKYGSGSATGVINILPASIAAQDTIEGEFTSVYKTNNQHVGASLGMKWHKNDWFGRFRVSAQDFADYGVPSDSFVYNGYVLPIENERLKNTAGQELNASFELGTIGDWGNTRVIGSTYNLEAGIFPGAMGIPRSYNLQHDGDYRNIDIPYQNVQHHKISSNTKLYTHQHQNEWDIIAAFQQNNRIEYSEAHSHGSAIVLSNEALNLKLNTYSLSANLERTTSQRITHEGGVQGQFRENQVGGFEFLIPAYESMDLGAYYRLVWNANSKWVWNGGLRLGTFWMDAEEAILNQSADSGADGNAIRADAFERNFFNWSAALGLSYSPKQNSTFYLNLNKSYRNPSIAELGSNGVHHGTFRHERGDSDLEQEQGYHLDLGWKRRTGRTQLQLAGYGSFYQGYIYLRPTPRFSPLPEAGQLFQYTQNDAYFAGFEWQSNTDITEYLAFKLGADYVWNYNIDTKLPLPFTPPARILSDLKAHWDWDKRINHLEFTFAYNYVFAQDRVDRNELKTPEYHLLRIGLALHVQTKRSEIRFRCTVQNLMNTAYFNHLSRYRYLNISEQGRNIVFGIDVPFGTKI